MWPFFLLPPGTKTSPSVVGNRFPDNITQEDRRREPEVLAHPNKCSEKGKSVRIFFRAVFEWIYFTSADTTPAPQLKADLNARLASNAVRFWGKAVSPLNAMRSRFSVILQINITFTITHYNRKRLDILEPTGTHRHGRAFAPLVSLFALSSFVDTGRSAYRSERGASPTNLMILLTFGWEEKKKNKPFTTCWWSSQTTKENRCEGIIPNFITQGSCRSFITPNI